MPNVFKSGSLSLLDPSGFVQACNGIALPLTSCYEKKSKYKCAVTGSQVIFTAACQSGYDFSYVRRGILGGFLPCMMWGCITAGLRLTSMVQRIPVKNSWTSRPLMKRSSSHHTTSVNSHPLTPHDAPKWWRIQLQPAVFTPLPHPDRPPKTQSIG